MDLCTESHMVYWKRVRTRACVPQHVGGASFFPQGSESTISLTRLSHTYPT